MSRKGRPMLATGAMALAIAVGVATMPIAAAENPTLPQTAELTTPVRIDVLALYPRELFKRSSSVEAGLHEFIWKEIEYANLIFSNSNVNAFYNLVGIVPVIASYHEAQPPQGLVDALNWLNEAVDNPTSEVAGLRNAFGADVVAIFIPYDWEQSQLCGVGNLPRNDGTYKIGTNITPYAMGDRALVALRDGCGQAEYTLAHEIGHTYGMNHHDEPEAEVAKYLAPWARGYAFIDYSEKPEGIPRLTVMGTCYAGQACNRIPYFSDPDRTYNGVPIGARDANGEDTHNNTRFARDRVMGHSNFRPQSPNTPPRASFSVSCSGRTCTFNGGSSTDDATIPSANYWWDFGDGTLIVQSGSVVSYTYNSVPSGTTFRVHLVVKDSGGQTDVAWSTATVQPVYEGYHEVANCRTISGWAWDKTRENDPISVDIYRDTTKVATIPANLCRQDLVNAGKGNGCHGFAYTPNSAWRDGRLHSARVRFGGTSMSLSSTPRDLICNACILCDRVPQENLSTGGQVYTVATQLSSNRAGLITRLGFHRASGETGTNTLRLWTDSGTLLASVSTSCGYSGWCWGTLSSPVAIAQGTRYRVSVNTNTAQSKTGCGLGSGITTGPLTAHQGFWTSGNAFPTTPSCSNFFVDVRFDM